MPVVPEFQCRLCRSRTYVAVGRSRLGARFYACAGCSGVFMDPDRWTRPAHEQVTPGLDHLQPRAARPATGGPGPVAQQRSGRRPKRPSGV